MSKITENKNEYAKHSGLPKEIAIKTKSRILEMNSMLLMSFWAYLQMKKEKKYGVDFNWGNKLGIT